VQLFLNKDKLLKHNTFSNLDIVEVGQLSIMSKFNSLSSTRKWGGVVEAHSTANSVVDC